MFLGKTAWCCRSVIPLKFLTPVTHTRGINQCLAREAKIIKWKRPIRITPRKSVSLAKTASDLRVPEGRSFTVENDTGIPPYVEVDPHNPKLVRILTAVKTKRQRYSNMMIMLEGKRLIKEALVADMEPILILFSRKRLLKGLPFEPSHIQPESTIVHGLSYRHMRVWSSLTTCPGIVGVFRMPNLEKNVPLIGTLPITVVCDNLRDPGNLGSVLRVAAALPVDKVILLTGCADLWDPKVIRGSCGAMFHLKVFNNATWDDVKDECHDRIILADHETEEKDVKEIEESGIVEAEDHFGDTNTTSGQLQDDEDDDDNWDHIENLRKKYNLSSKSYTDITFTKDNSYTIILGGETEGLSESSFQFASEMNGIRANISLAATVSSLNAATALGILAFEIKRQILKPKQ